MVIKKLLRISLAYCTVACLLLGISSLKGESPIKPSVGIYFINLEDLLSKVEKWAPDLLDNFEKRKIELIKEVEGAKEKLEKAKKEIQSKSRIFSEKGQEEASSRLIKLESELLSKEKAAQVELQRAAQKLEQKMGDRLQQIAKENAVKKKTSVVFGVMPGGILRVLYVEDSFDDTLSILDELVKKYGPKEHKDQKAGA